MTSVASVDYILLRKWGLLLKKRICSKRSKFFTLRVDYYQEERQKKEVIELLPLNVYHTPSNFLSASDICRINKCG